MQGENKKLIISTPHEDDLLPAGFYCPLTGIPMTDPQTNSHGETYDKTSIQGNPQLAAQKWRPNFNLKNAIAEVLQQYPQLKGSTPTHRREMAKKMQLGADFILLKALFANLNSKMNFIQYITSFFYYQKPLWPQPEIKGLKAFKCAITFEEMILPALTPFGHSYENEAIMNWLQEHKIDPMTQKQLALTDLQHNKPLWDAISDYPRACYQLANFTYINHQTEWQKELLELQQTIPLLPDKKLSLTTGLNPTDEALFQKAEYYYDISSRTTSLGYFKTVAKNSNYPPAYLRIVEISKDLSELKHFSLLLRHKWAWFREEAANGNINAQFYLGVWYSFSTLFFDDRQAMLWWLLAAKQGHSIAQYNLGCCYRDESGVQKNMKEAVKWFRLAAHQGQIRAQNQLGLCYEDGLGVAKNPSEAVKWYRLAAQNGYTAAQFNLALCYKQGYGLAKNLKEAIYWYKIAAEGGDTRAQFNLFNHYSKGDGVKQDQKEAIKWCKRAAEAGDTKAQYGLSIAYELGEGIIKDKNEAEKWLKLSAQGGYDQAKVVLNEPKSKSEEKILSSVGLFAKTEPPMQSGVIKIVDNDKRSIVDFKFNISINKFEKFLLLKSIIEIIKPVIRQIESTQPVFEVSLEWLTAVNEYNPDKIREFSELLDISESVFRTATHLTNSCKRTTI